MSDTRNPQRETSAAPAETTRQEGAPDIVMGRTAKTSAGTVSDGAIDASDPKMAAEVTKVADQVHANA